MHPIGLKSASIKSKIPCCISSYSKNGFPESKFKFTLLSKICSMLENFILIVIVFGLCTVSQETTKKGQLVLHVYSIANFVATWLKWIQIKRLQLTSSNLSNTYRAICRNLRPFQLWGDKISYTLKMQGLLSFLWVLITCIGHSSM